MDIMQEENEEDFEKMAAVIPSEEPYLKTPVYKHILHRIGWLLILMFSAILTGSVLEHYESAFATMPLLVAFIPMIMGTGGNSGSQSSTIMIRAMATEEVELKDWLKALWKELRIALIVGAGLFIVNSIRIMIQYQDLELCLVLGLSLVATVIVAKTIGCLLPILVKKIKLDPAVVAAPIITTLVDLCSIIIYFQIATFFMAQKGVI
jgi:magnesium transporter